MKTEDEIFEDYLKENFKEYDLNLDKSLKETLDFNAYMGRVRFSELCDSILDLFHISKNRDASEAADEPKKWKLILIAFAVLVLPQIITMIIIWFNATVVIK